MKTKLFNKEHASYGEEAELKLVELFHASNDTAEHQPDGIYGVDILVNGKTRVEVERRIGWATGQFPYPTVNIPKRRAAKFKDENDLLIIVNGDMTEAISVSYDVFTQSKKTTLSNRYVQGEEIYQVGTNACTKHDLTKGTL